MDSSFFQDLKEVCRKIDTDINNIKNKMISQHDDSEEEEIFAKRICDIQGKIKTLQVEANSLKTELEPKLSHTRDFIENFKELVTETEASIKKKEDYLIQRGYKPKKSVPEIQEPTVKDATPTKNENEGAATSLLGASTPSLLDYGIVSDIQSNTMTDIASTPELKIRKSSIEDLSMPPDLEIVKPIKTNGESGSTPVLDAIITSGVKTKETPPLPESHPYTFPSTPKLNI